MTALSRDDRLALTSYLQERLAGPVSLDVWTRRQSTIVRTDRDPCTHCDDTLQLARDVASLHPAISLTLYDMEKHSQRAEEAGIDRPPVTVIRGHGRELRVVGFWSGLLLPAFIDTLVLAGAGVSPLKDESREVLAALESDVSLEMLVTPYDPYSPHSMVLACSLGVESKRVRVQVTEVAEFPMLAATRAVTEVPVLLLNGRRYAGAWEEDDLIEQLRRVAAGDDAPVIRDRAPSTPFLTEDEVQRAAEQQAQGGQQPAPPGGGLVLPGQR